MTVTALPLPFETPAPVKGQKCLYEFILDDAFNWLEAAAPRSVHAVVTDPPFGLVEFSSQQLRKRRDGHGGVWRQPIHNILVSAGGLKKPPRTGVTLRCSAEVSIPDRLAGIPQTGTLTAGCRGLA